MGQLTDILSTPDFGQMSPDQRAQVVDRYYYQNVRPTKQLSRDVYDKALDQYAVQNNLGSLAPAQSLRDVPLTPDNNFGQIYFTNTDKYKQEIDIAKAKLRARGDDEQIANTFTQGVGAVWGSYGFAASQHLANMLKGGEKIFKSKLNSVLDAVPYIKEKVTELGQNIPRTGKDLVNAGLALKHALFELTKDADYQDPQSKAAIKGIDENLWKNLDNMAGEYSKSSSQDKEIRKTLKAYSPYAVETGKTILDAVSTPFRVAESAIAELGKQIGARLSGETPSILQSAKNIWENVYNPSKGTGAKESLDMLESELVRSGILPKEEAATTSDLFGRELFKSSLLVAGNPAMLLGLFKRQGVRDLVLKDIEQTPQGQSIGKTIREQLKAARTESQKAAIFEENIKKYSIAEQKPIEMVAPPKAKRITPERPVPQVVDTPPVIQQQPPVKGAFVVENGKMVYKPVASVPLPPSAPAPVVSTTKQAAQAKETPQGIAAQPQDNSSDNYARKQWINAYEKKTGRKYDETLQKIERAIAKIDGESRHTNVIEAMQYSFDDRGNPVNPIDRLMEYASDDRVDSQGRPLSGLPERAKKILSEIMPQQTELFDLQPKAKVVEAGTQAEQAKEPWMMTREEYAPYNQRAVNALNDQQRVLERSLDNASKKITAKGNSLVPPSIKSDANKASAKRMDDLYAQIQAIKDKRSAISQESQAKEAEHRAIVERALSSGKPVPAEVLADYPDLQPKAEATQAPPESAPPPQEAAIAKETAPAPTPESKIDNGGYAITYEDPSGEMVTRHFEKVKYDALPDDMKKLVDSQYQAALSDTSRYSSNADVKKSINDEYSTWKNIKEGKTKIVLETKKTGNEVSYNITTDSIEETFGRWVDRKSDFDRVIYNKSGQEFVNKRTADKKRYEEQKIEEERAKQEADKIEAIKYEENKKKIISKYSDTKFKKQQIDITTGKDKTEKIDALVYKHIAIHRIKGTNRYSLTHIPTGLKISDYSLNIEARIAASRFAELLPASKDLTSFFNKKQLSNAAGKIREDAYANIEPSTLSTNPIKPRVQPSGAFNPEAQASTAPAAESPKTEGITDEGGVRHKVLKINDILVNAPDALSAQKQLKDNFNIDVTLSEIQRAMTQAKGGAFEAPEKLYASWVSKQAKESAAASGLDDFAPMTDADLNEIGRHTMSGMWEGLKTETKDIVRSVINSVHLYQNLLYKNTEGRPIAEKIIDLHTQKIAGENLSKVMGDLLLKIEKKSPKDAEAIRKLALEYDRDTSKSIVEYVNKARSEGKISDNVYRGIKAFDTLRQISYEQLKREVLDGQTGPRFIDKGEYAVVEYTLKNGEARTKTMREAELEKFRNKYPDAEIVDKKNIVEVRQYDEETEKYTKKEHEYKNKAEYNGIVKNEQDKFLSNILPYQNYMSHLREGKYWVNAYDPSATGIGEALVFSTRVGEGLNAKENAENLARILKKEAPGMRIEVNKHTPKDFDRPTLASPIDIENHLIRIGVDLNSDAAQKIVKAHRQMSTFFSKLIHSKNIPGFKTDYASLVKGMVGQSESTSRRIFRYELNKYSKNVDAIKDPNTKKAAKEYIELLKNNIPGWSTFNAIQEYSYVVKLANNLLYATQNMTEPMWFVSRLADEHGFSGMTKITAKAALPLPKDLQPLFLKAYKEGLLQPFFKDDITAKNKFSSRLMNLDIIGQKSEAFSSALCFRMALIAAKEKGLTGDATYRYAYQQLFNVAKPLYIGANIPGILQKAPAIAKPGMQFLRWTWDFYDKLLSGNIKDTWKSKVTTLAIWALMTGIGSMPMGKKILEKLGLYKPGAPKNTLSRFLEGGIWQAVTRTDSGFMSPTIIPKLATDALNPSRTLNIAGSTIIKAWKDYHKFGVVGALSAIPIIGAPAKGYLRGEYGIVEMRNGKAKVVWLPKSIYEKVVSYAGFTPESMSDYYYKKYRADKQPKKKASSDFTNIKEDF